MKFLLSSQEVLKRLTRISYEAFKSLKEACKKFCKKFIRCKVLRSKNFA